MNDFSKLTDAELVDLFIARHGKDDRAFTEIFHRYNDFVIRVIFRYFSHEQDIEDLAQEIFFKVYRNLKQYEGRSSLKTWLFSIATNTAKTEIRNRSRRPAVSDRSSQDMDEQKFDSEEYLQRHNNDHQQDFQQAFSQLNSLEQKILLLKDVEEFTYNEIADHLNISVSAAKMRVQRARLAIKHHYRGDDHDQ